MHFLNLFPKNSESTNGKMNTDKLFMVPVNIYSVEFDANTGQTHFPLDFCCYIIEFTQMQFYKCTIIWTIEKLGKNKISMDDLVTSHNAENVQKLSCVKDN